MKTLPEIAQELKDALTEGVRDGNFPAPNQEDLAEAWSRLGDRDGQRLRLSFGSRCARRLWYSAHRPEAAEPPNPEAFVGFSMGDWWELIAYNAIRTRLVLNNSDLELRDRGMEVIMDGIKGHIDGLVYQKEPTKNYPNHKEVRCVVDFKQTSKWVFRKWFEGRIPDELWGYRHQAANYLEAIRQQTGDAADGFVWVVHLKDVNGFEVGWATTEELAPYLDESRDFFHKAKADTPPPRCEGFPGTAPCRGQSRKYCPFYNTCSNDR